MCKPWKANGFATERKEGEKFSDHARRIAARIDQAWSEPSWC